MAAISGEEVGCRLPGRAGVIGVRPADYKRYGSERLPKRRMPAVQAQVQALQVAQSGADVSDLVYARGLMQGRAARHKEHKAEQGCSDSAVNLSRCGSGQF